MCTESSPWKRYKTLFTRKLFISNSQVLISKDLFQLFVMVVNAPHWRKELRIHVVKKILSPHSFKVQKLLLGLHLLYNFLAMRDKITVFLAGLKVRSIKDHLFCKVSSSIVCLDTVPQLITPFLWDLVSSIDKSFGC